MQWSISMVHSTSGKDPDPGDSEFQQKGPNGPHTDLDPTESQTPGFTKEIPDSHIIPKE